jgi:hypothetical protein
MVKWSNSRPRAPVRPPPNVAKPAFSPNVRSRFSSSVPLTLAPTAGIRGQFSGNFAPRAGRIVGPNGVRFTHLCLSRAALRSRNARFSSARAALRARSARFSSARAALRTRSEPFLFASAALRTKSARFFLARAALRTRSARFSSARAARKPSGAALETINADFSSARAALKTSEAARKISAAPRKASAAARKTSDQARTPAAHPLNTPRPPPGTARTSTPHPPRLSPRRSRDTSPFPPPSHQNPVHSHATPQRSSPDSQLDDWRGRWRVFDPEGALGGRNGQAMKHRRAPCHRLHGL